MLSLQHTLSEPELTTSLMEIVSASPGPLVRVESSALSGLERQALKGRGWEICGLVLGSLAWDGTAVNITGFVSSGVRATPEGIAALKAERGDQVIGYFRGELRHGFSVRQEDALLLRQLFPAGDCCFLTIRAGPRITSKVEVYYVRAKSHPVLLKRFPIVGNQVENATRSRHSTATPPTSPVRETASFKPPKLPILTTSTERKAASWVGAGALAALSIASLAFALGRQSAPSSKLKLPTVSKATITETNQAKIDLNVLSRGPELEITWNPTHPAIGDAVRGTLIITDGAAGDIGLDLAQMRSGRYVYRPVMKTVHILLMIYQADGSFIGAMREFTGKPSRPNTRPVEPRPESVLSPPPVIAPPPDPLPTPKLTTAVAANRPPKPARRHRRKSRRASVISGKSATLP